MKASNTHDALQYSKPNVVVLDRDFILTTEKQLVAGLPYLYSEGCHHIAVRLLKVWKEDGFIYLHLEELQNPRSFTASWNLHYEGNYWLWFLSDFETLTDLPK